MSTESDFDKPEFAKCESCEIGHRRSNGYHVATQSKGMIPTEPCDAIRAYHVGNATESNDRPWTAYIDGHRFLGARGFPRRYKTEQGALRAARKASPYLEVNARAKKGQ